MRLVVEIDNHGPAQQLAVGLAATRKANPDCLSTCEMVAGLPDGGSQWFQPPLTFVDAGATFESEQDIIIGSVINYLPQRQLGWTRSCGGSFPVYSNVDVRLVVTVGGDAGRPTECDSTEIQATQ